MTGTAWFLQNLLRNSCQREGRAKHLRHHRDLAERTPICYISFSPDWTVPVKYQGKATSSERSMQ